MAGSKLLAHPICPYVGVVLGMGNAWSRLSETERWLQGEDDTRTPLEILCEATTYVQPHAYALDHDLLALLPIACVPYPGLTACAYSECNGVL